MRQSLREFERGALYMTASAVMLSVFTLFGKFGTANLPFFLLVFFRFAVPFILLLPFLLWRHTVHDLFIVKNLKLQFLRAACTLVYQYSLFYYLLHASVLDATVLQNTAPLLLPVLEWFFFKMRFSFKAMISIFISFVGVLCILQPDRELIGSLSVAGLFAILGQAGSQVLYGHQARNENQSSSLFYFFFLSAVVSGVVYLCSGEFLVEHPMLESAGASWIYLNAIALGLASIFNQSFRGLAYKHGKASSLAPFLYLSLISSGFLDWLIFHQLPNLLSIVGAILVCLGGLIQVYHSRMKKVS